MVADKVCKVTGCKSEIIDASLIFFQEKGLDVVLWPSADWMLAFTTIPPYLSVFINIYQLLHQSLNWLSKTSAAVHLHKSVELPLFAKICLTHYFQTITTCNYSLPFFVCIVTKWKVPFNTLARVARSMVSANQR